MAMHSARAAATSVPTTMTSRIGWRITWNTVAYHFLFLVTGTIASLLLALLLNEVHGRFRARFYQSAMFLPHFISWIIVSYFVYAFLGFDNGLLNRILIGLGIDPVSWYSQYSLVWRIYDHEWWSHHDGIIRVSQCRQHSHQSAQCTRHSL